ERGTREVRVRREKILRSAVDVGEVTASSAGDEDLLADSFRAFEHRDATATLTSFDSTHQPGRAAAQNDDVRILRAIWNERNQRRCLDAKSAVRFKDSKGQFWLPEL